MIFINGLMQKHYEISGKKVNGLKPFFPALFNPSRRADFCVSPEHGKLCFEALEMHFVPQNNLPLQGLKTLSEVEVLCRLKID
ncbi:hypothetical protein D3C86_1475810 [compost metagenome]